MCVHFLVGDKLTLPNSPFGLVPAMVIQAAYPCLCPLDSEGDAQDCKREASACMHCCICECAIQMFYSLSRYVGCVCCICTASVLCVKYE